MKKFLLAILLLFMMPFIFGQGYKVLFIGNSYTYVNNLPDMIVAMAQSSGDTMVYSSSVPGGSTFQSHVNNSTTTSLIQQGNWDFVVLQGQSQEPSFPDGQFNSQTYPYAQQLCEMVRQYNPDAEIMFYMTWGRKNGDQVNCAYFEPLCTYEGMDSLLYLRYMTMAEDFNAEVSPVGALWHFIRDNQPNIELYSSDESHPSLEGTYAAACSFYSVLFRKNPTELSYNPGISEESAEIIRMAASKVVYDSLAKWFVEPPESSGSMITSLNGKKCVIYPNPAKEYVEIQSDGFISEICIYTEEGKLVWSKTGLDKFAERIPLHGFSAGLYFIQIVDNEGIRVNKKIILK